MIKKHILLLQLSCILLLTMNLKAQETIQTSDSISLLAWNMYLLPAIAPVPHRIPRALKIVEALNQSEHTILCLQEAFHHKAVAEIKKGLATKYPYQYGPFFEAKGAFAASSGLLICSKIPLQIVDSILYKEAIGIDAKANKGAILMEANIAEKKFQVILTHMQSGKYNEVRRKQFEQIRSELIDKYSKENVPLFVCGDLNTERNNQVEYDFTLSKLQVSDGEISGLQKESYDGTTNKLAQKVWKKASTNLDYVLLKKNNANIEINHRQVKTYRGAWSKKNHDLSDHYGVECVFKLK